jgi:putative nucleotidyltransferase with HDIG domain
LISNISTNESGTKEVAALGALAISSMLSAAMNHERIDIEGAQDAANKIAEIVCEDGLSAWIETVRRHHKGTYQHCLLVAGVAADFGRSLGVSSIDIKRISSAAMFHDLGKACIPLTVLDKPGRLDFTERKLIEVHPAAGFEILKETGRVTPEILDAVRHHHEFLDGSGYPDGLSGSSISDIVRVLTIADIFSALIEDRRYKPCLPREEAYEIICSMGDKLERPLVGAFRDVALVR